MLKGREKASVWIRLTPPRIQISKAYNKGNRAQIHVFLTTSHFTHKQWFLIILSLVFIGITATILYNMLINIIFFCFIFHIQQ